MEEALAYFGPSNQEKIISNHVYFKELMVHIILC
jgi:hypothetical protein